MKHQRRRYIQDRNDPGLAQGPVVDIDSGCRLASGLAMLEGPMPRENKKENTKQKSLFETLADTVKAAAESIAHPTQGTPMEMPLNESGYALTHLQPSSKPAGGRTVKKKKGAKKPRGRAAAKKSKRIIGTKKIGKSSKKRGKRAVTGIAKKKKAKSKR